MHKDPPPPAARLTDLQTARIDYARRELETLRAEDLAQLEPASLVLIVERLRIRLYETLEVVDEVCDTGPPDQTNSHP
jgi:hypothetical protein